MRGLADIKKSLLEISKPIMGGMAIDVMVLDALPDNEFGLIAEFMELHKAGFSSEEIEDMMGSESYEMAIAVAQKVNETVELLTAPPMIKLAKAKKRKLEVVDLCDDDEGVDEDVDLE